jgi:hypothetical protein
MITICNKVGTSQESSFLEVFLFNLKDELLCSYTRKMEKQLLGIYHVEIVREIIESYQIELHVRVD